MLDARPQEEVGVNNHRGNALKYGVQESSEFVAPMTGFSRLRRWISSTTRSATSVVRVVRQGRQALNSLPSIAPPYDNSRLPPFPCINPAASCDPQMNPGVDPVSPTYSPSPPSSAIIALCSLVAFLSTSAPLGSASGPHQPSPARVAATSRGHRQTRNSGRNCAVSLYPIVRWSYTIAWEILL